MLLGWPFDRAPLQSGRVQGIPWAIVWNGNPHMPAVNGYAQIPAEGHPWSTCTDYAQLDVDVHGGITFGPHAEYRNPLTGKVVIPTVTLADCGGWIGFDTNHGFDVWTDEALAEIGVTREPTPGLPITSGKDWDHYWTVERVAMEAQHLAHQVANAKGGSAMRVCITGSPTDDDGVCIEHGETACVITVPDPKPDEGNQSEC